LWGTIVAGTVVTSPLDRSIRLRELLYSSAVKTMPPAGRVVPVWAIPALPQAIVATVNATTRLRRHIVAA
jgi:hypothetical protein